MILATMMMLAVCASACADTVVYFKQNPLPAQAVKTVSVTNTPVLKNVSSYYGHLYVRHYLWSDVPGYYGSNNHTNYFQASPSNGDTRVGGNWMAPDTANFIKSGSLQYDSFGVACRGNTKYADAGIPIIRISGYTDGNA